MTLTDLFRASSPTARATPSAQSPHSPPPTHSTHADAGALRCIFESRLAAHRQLFAELDALAPPVVAAANRLSRCLAEGGKLLLCGNGGSAADSQHMAAELTGRFLHDRRPLAAIALTTDTSALTCIANDYGFEQVYERQVRALGRAGDCLVGLSTSGESANLLRAFESARSAGITTIGLLGRQGGRLAGLCDLAVVVPGEITAHIQEAHIFIVHVLCGLIERNLALDRPG